LILAGLADFKNDLNTSDLFDSRLKKIVIKIVDTAYGFENGFNQAIDLSKESLKDVKFFQEKQLLANFCEEIASNTGKFSYGMRDTLYAIESSAVHTLILHDNLEITRFLVRNSNGDTKTLFLFPEQEKDDKYLKDANNHPLEIIEKSPVVEWFADNYKSMGLNLQLVTDNSQQGSQFVKGFGGVGGLLRFKVDFSLLDVEEEKAEDNDGDESDDYDYIY